MLENTCLPLVYQKILIIRTNIVGWSSSHEPAHIEYWKNAAAAIYGQFSYRTEILESIRFLNNEWSVFIIVKIWQTSKFKPINTVEKKELKSAIV